MAGRKQYVACSDGHVYAVGAVPEGVVALATAPGPGVIVPSGGISYPGDDGTEPAEVREWKARAYAEEFVENANRVAARKAAEREIEESACKGTANRIRQWVRGLL